MQGHRDEDRKMEKLRDGYIKKQRDREINR